MNAVLADESCDFRVVRALRAAGHDVVAVIEAAPGAADAAVIDLAMRQRKIFVTEDRDFGRLVNAAAKPNCGVILLRFPSSARAALPGMLIEFLAKQRPESGRSLRCAAAGTDSVERHSGRLIRCKLHKRKGPRRRGPFRFSSERPQ